MPTPPLTDELAAEAAAALAEHGSANKAAVALGIARSTFQNRVHRAAERGLMGTEPVLPGYAIKSVASKKDGAWIKQTKEHGEKFVLPEGQDIRALSVLTDPEDRVIMKWTKTGEGKSQTDILRDVAAALKEDLPRLDPAAPPRSTFPDLLNQFTVTDSHFGMLAWREETGSDYDLRIAEQLLLDWFAASIDLSPAAHTAIFAQIGDLMHHDALESVTPAHRNVLDADSRLQKIIRVVIRTIRRIIDMLLAKHQHVHIIMASGNHDPASSAWLREMLAAMYENEPRISVDNSPSLYYAYEWGRTALFYHHGHKRGLSNVDSTLAGKFREMYGRSLYAYAHVGHKHSDEGKKGTLMYVEQHETLAAPDAFAAAGGWLSGRSAKRITYHKQFGEVSRDTMRPEMVMGAYAAANDNEPMRRAA